MSGTQLSCIIIDGDEIDRLATLSYAKKYPFLNVAGVFSSATQALSSVNQTPVDVMLSDVDMPDVKGLEFRSKMMKIPVCVFISAYPDYAADSFEMEAFDFMANSGSDLRTKASRSIAFSPVNQCKKAGTADRCGEWLNQTYREDVINACLFESLEDAAAAVRALINLNFALHSFNLHFFNQ